MPVPFEALIPYGLMLGLMMTGGLGLTYVKIAQNGGKLPRHNTDRWDRQMMERDRRLTGYLRGQSDRPKAPDGFELNNAWKLEHDVR